MVLYDFRHRLRLNGLFSCQPSRRHSSLHRLFSPHHQRHRLFHCRPVLRQRISASLLKLCSNRTVSIDPLPPIISAQTVVDPCNAVTRAYKPLWMAVSIVLKRHDCDLFRWLRTMRLLLAMELGCPSILFNRIRPTRRTQRLMELVIYPFPLIQHRPCTLFEGTVDVRISVQFFFSSLSVTLGNSMLSDNVLFSKE